MSRESSFCGHLSLWDCLSFTDFGGLHGYHHSNCLETLCLMETNRSKKDPFSEIDTYFIGRSFIFFIFFFLPPVNP